LRNDPPNKNPEALENFYHGLGQVPVTKGFILNMKRGRSAPFKYMHLEEKTII